VGGAGLFLRWVSNLGLAALLNALPGPAQRRAGFQIRLSVIF
jgi:hypothetical protein